TYFIADRLYQVCFSRAYSAEDHQRIESCGTWLLRHMQTRGTSHAIAVAFYIVVEGVVGIQLRIYLHTLQTRDGIGCFYVGRIIPLQGHVYILAVFRWLGMIACRHVDGCRIALRCAALHQNAILQFTLSS